MTGSGLQTPDAEPVLPTRSVRVEPTIQRNRLLDGMRGFAAIAVMLFHMSAVFDDRVFLSGYLAVDFFFVLSGYVIARAYTQRLREGLTFVRFAEIRVVRLYPVYLVGFALGLMRIGAAALLGDPRAPAPGYLAASAALNLLFLPTPLAGRSTFPVNPPFWSLSLEFIINLIFGAILYRAAIRALVVIAVISACGVVIGTVLMNTVDAGVGHNTFYLGVARACWGFTVGMILARIGGPGRSGTSNVLALCIGAILILALYPAVPATLRIAYELGFVLIAAPLLLLAGTTVEVRGWFADFCGFLGDLSYPLYAVHYPLVLPLGMGMRALGIDGFRALFLASAACIVVAYIVAKLDDKLRRNLSHRLALRRSARLQAL